MVPLAAFCLLISENSHAMRPYFDPSGFLLLKYEYGDYSTYTVKEAIIYGAESWYKTYWTYINILTLYGTYMDNLPYFGYTEINSYTLAMMI